MVSYRPVLPSMRTDRAVGKCRSRQRQTVVVVSSTVSCERIAGFCFLKNTLVCHGPYTGISVGRRWYVELVNPGVILQIWTDPFLWAETCGRLDVEKCWYCERKEKRVFFGCLTANGAVSKMDSTASVDGRDRSNCCLPLIMGELKKLSLSLMDCESKSYWYQLIKERKESFRLLSVSVVVPQPVFLFPKSKRISGLRDIVRATTEKESKNADCFIWSSSQQQTSLPFVTFCLGEYWLISVVPCRRCVSAVAVNFGLWISFSYTFWTVQKDLVAN